jgi:hypothetical protein
MLFDFIDFFLVTPAKAGVHLIDQVVEKVDTGLRRYDGERAKNGESARCVNAVARPGGGGAVGSGRG